ncbi:hypothetical protein Zmor_005173 [Zophobas morio]|uniref:Peptidase S1 domain-containing protein n=1 Tax=Zophobas morio TaxID=2755281 RepID=A0AA38INX2_9CUCU|nr:hypothetical protein Zmor_005173 [Zophobas morio]
MGRSVWSFLLLCQLTLVFGNKWDCADYYWRDYFGTIPYDAVPAGKDHNGNNRYIGLVYIRGFELLPATILPQQGVAQTTAYTHVLTTSQYVKILCSPYKAALEWIHVQSKDLHDYESRNLIPGGSEVGESLYIGRVFENGDVIIGKIFRHERANRGIWYPVGDTFKNSLTYELLLYNCYRKDFPTFDVRTGVSDKQNHTEIVFQ